MKRIIVFLLVAFVLLAVTGCAGKDANHDMAGMNHATVLVNVKIGIDPAEPKTGQNTKLWATVTQGGKAVDDADEVEFEIWRDGDTEHEKIPAKLQGEGKYVIEKTFAKAGDYHVISHVTARDMHVMPQKQFAVVD